MPDCGDEPDLLPSSLVRCGEVPLCQFVHCFRRVACLIANSTALVLPGCRTPSDEPYFCVCPLKNDPIKFRSFFEMASLSGGPASGNGVNNLNTIKVPDMLSSSTTTLLGSSTAKDDGGGGLSGGAIAGIVIGVIVGVILIAAIIFFIFKKIRDQRKNHGEYRPQFEENLHAKDLPYLPPPNIEGHLG
uniref:Uncharacterized protein n=1 Tax=Panagrolaimus sp. JU765 TaxID=591449 RepID=A0AC34PXM8_9BILA